MFVLLAEANGLATMGRLFLIAAVLVSPFALVKGRRILSDRRSRLAALAPPEPEAPVPDPSDLATVIAAITAGASSLVPGETFEVLVPAEPTLDGRVADALIASSIIEDAMSRSRVEVAERHGPMLVCRRML